ncbi:hypothetical protein D3C72_2578550 [compost metagenome]
MAAMRPVVSSISWSAPVMMAWAFCAIAMICKGTPLLRMAVACSTTSFGMRSLSVK